MIQAAAVYEGHYLLGTSIARPLIAKRIVQIAKSEGARPSLTGPPARGTIRSASN